MSVSRDSTRWYRDSPSLTNQSQPATLPGGRTRGRGRLSAQGRIFVRLLGRHSRTLAQAATLLLDTLHAVRVTYDPEADAAYVYLRDPEARKGTVTSLPVEDAPGMIVLDFDVDGCLFGIEVLDASTLLPSELLDTAARP
jgi:uncharacterized protein YuzE